MTPRTGWIFFSALSYNSLVSVLDTQRAFRSDTCPSMALNSLVRCFWNKDTVRCAGLGVEVLGRRQEQVTQTLIVRL